MKSSLPESEIPCDTCTEKDCPDKWRFVYKFATHCGRQIVGHKQERKEERTVFEEEVVQSFKTYFSSLMRESKKQLLIELTEIYNRS